MRWLAGEMPYLSADTHVVVQGYCGHDAKVPGERDHETLTLAVVLLCRVYACALIYVTLCYVFFQSHDPSMFGSRNKHAARSFTTPRA